jgi:xanthine phosphoribosyltransferase
MERLRQRIQEDGIVVSDTVIHVHRFLNHAVDPVLVSEIGEAFATQFQEEKITKVLTIESSGIAIAFATALQMGVPMVYARRLRASMIQGEQYAERVPSFTKGIVTEIVVAKEVLSPNDRILYVDDFIANGDAAKGLMKIIHRSGAQLVGAGIVIEKTFQHGGAMMRDAGVKYVSLAKISSLSSGKVIFTEELP